MLSAIEKPRVATIGVLGCGTVGGGVVERLVRVNTIAGMPVRLGHVLVRTLTAQGRPPGSATHLTDDAAAIVDDPVVDVVVECIGGLEPALAYVERALKNGKHVVTANKTLLATWGPRLFALARRSGSALRFEGAVAGAIPVMRALAHSLAVEDVVEVCGIINGTTNFVLTAMESGLDLAAALSRAQEEGYAEADPFDDIHAVDAAQKLALLIAEAFGVWIPWRDIPRQGISRVSPADIEFARGHACSLRLLACARRHLGGIEACVAPVLIPLTHDFARVRRAGNLVRVSGIGCGTLTFAGAGAGRCATASAVLGDIADIVTRLGQPAAGPSQPLLAPARCSALELPRAAGSAYPRWED